MRRKDREMNEEFAYFVLDKALFATMSMIDEEGLPYGIPVSLGRKDNIVYFHSAKQGTKLDVLKKNPKVCLSAVSKMKPVKGKFTIEYESAVAKGTASFVESDEEKIEALRLVSQRFTPENMPNFDAAIEKSLKITEIIRIEIESITGKRKQYDRDGVEMKWGRME